MGSVEPKMSQHVYLFASSLMAECPDLTAPQALMLALRFVGLREEMEQSKYIAELWEIVHEAKIDHDH